MGKTRKRLTMAKYARKYANIRANIAKMQGKVSNEIAETTNNIQLSNQQTTQKEEVVAKVVPVVAEKQTAIIEEVAEEVSVSPVEMKAQIVEPDKPVEDIVEEIVSPKKKLSAKKTTTTKKRSTNARKKTGTRIASSRQKGKSAAAN